jgi:hypothetical protein
MTAFFFIVRTWGAAVLHRYTEKAGGAKPPLQVELGLVR